MLFSPRTENSCEKRPTHARATPRTMKCSLLIAAFAGLACSPRTAVPPARTDIEPGGRGAPAAPGPSRSDAHTAAIEAEGPVRSTAVGSQPGAEAPTAAPTPAFSDSAPTPPTTREATGHPRVTVRYIGMHIGGGPNDAATKAPFEHALADAFGAVTECCASAACSSGTFGLDLLVGKDGGRAQVSGVRTALPEGPARCIESAFGAVQFATPRHGATKLSYSIRLIEPKGAEPPATHPSN